MGGGGTWSTAQGTPGSILACSAALPGPDKGQAIFPSRSRQNSSAYSQAERKKMEGMLCKTPLGTVGLPVFPTLVTRGAPCQHLYLGHVVTKLHLPGEFRDGHLLSKGQKERPKFQVRNGGWV